MQKLTFKEYMNSKEKLRKAIQENPVASSSYIIKKYCKIRVGESRTNRYEVALKPKQRIIIEWRYDDINNPEPENIVFDDQNSNEHDVYWSGSKLTEWLSKNAVEEII